MIAFVERYLRKPFLANRKCHQLLIHFQRVLVLPVSIMYIFTQGYAVAQLVEALRHKSEGRGFDSRFFFSLT